MDEFVVYTNDKGQALLAFSAPIDPPVPAGATLVIDPQSRQVAHGDRLLGAVPERSVIALMESRSVTVGLMTPDGVEDEVDVTLRWARPG